MQTNDPLALIRMRRANAEAQEIALRGAHRRPAHRLRTSCAACWTARLLLAGVVIFWIIVATALVWRAMPERADILDLIAPTAAQARDTGWVGIMEGL